MASTVRSTPPSAGSEDLARDDVLARRGLLAALALIALALAVPAATGWYVHVYSFPPLHAEWDPRVGVGTVPAIILAVLGAKFAVDLARRLSWGRLLAAAYVGGLAWMLALAYTDGGNGIGVILNDKYEYLRTARATTDFHARLEEYVSRIGFDVEPHNWPVHIAGHPPGALGFFVVLVRVGLGSGYSAGMVVTLVAASTALAVLVTMRVLGAEHHARLAAPFLVLGPAAIWQSVSADAMFAAVAAWGMCALALAATGARDGARTATWAGWSVLAGLLLGYAVMLSYGLPVLGLLALVVLRLGGSWKPLPVAVVAALAVVGAFAAFGFWWPAGMKALTIRYFQGVGGRRQAAYWMWGNLAALACSAGPLLGAGVAILRRGRPAAERTVTWLAAAGVSMIAFADVSQMSRAEVERIWLPFVPWALLACALLPERWRRRGLAVQLGFALVLQHLLFTGW